MTAFARRDGVSGPYVWAWEIKTVNAKGLDLRLRLPSGWDALDMPTRQRIGERLSRGAVQAALTVERASATPRVRINEPVLEAVLNAMRGLEGRMAALTPTLDGLLALKGVMEVVEDEEDPAARARAETDILAALDTALTELSAMRVREGAALGAVLTQRLDEIAGLVARAESAPGRKPEAIRARLKEQVATLLEASERFDPDRLHQEAVLIAAKADVREELDRLASHLAQVTSLLAQAGPVGRKLDFLAQELHRETNTLCAKSNDRELTAIGLDLKAVVEQFREQVQNLE
jgi:uncharacterized protein (TIGR00255 family)